MRLNIHEVKQCVQGRLFYDIVDNIMITGVSSDSRNIKVGDLFIPLIGAKFDGHSFLNMAEEKGAIATFWQETVPIPEEVTIPLIIVADTLKALQDLAGYYREKINPFVIGITGSNGKTTTKDLITSILSSKYKVHKTKGNLNNHIGVPLTLLSMSDDTDAAVIEMGMSNLGEIELLSQIAKPDIALITNIGESHLEYLESRENIATAKLEILKGLKDGGWAVVQGDEPLLRSQMTQINKPLNLIWVGKNEKNDRYPIKISMKDLNAINFIDNENVQYSVKLLGNHNVINALMAIQVGKILNISVKDIQTGLANPELTGMRLEKMTAKNGSLILNDTYNASPTSMKAGLHLLSSIEQFKQKFAILGAMLELGSDAVKYHREIGNLCSQIGLNKLITTGELGNWIAIGAKEGGMREESIHHIESAEQIANLILQNTNSESVILIKGSRGIHLENVINKLV